MLGLCRKRNQDSCSKGDLARETEEKRGRGKERWTKREREEKVEAGREGGREGGGLFRPQHAGSKPRGTTGAIPLSSSLEGGD